MAIAPISSVSFRNNYNQVNFEGKKKEHKSSGMHIPSVVKAIPLATAIAMSPLTSVDASAQCTFENDRLIGSFVSPNGWLFERFGLVGGGVNCGVAVEDLDGDGRGDKLHLQRSGVVKVNSPRRGVYETTELEGLRVDTVGHYYDGLNKKELYYAKGPGYDEVWYTLDDGREVAKTNNHPHHMTFISETLYNQLTYDAEQFNIVVKEGK